MASTLTYLDSYCERAGDAALFAEPLNAVTNLFFILAAVLAARAIGRLKLHRHPELDSGSIKKLSIAQTRDAMDSRLRGNDAKGGGADKLIDLWLLTAALFTIGLGSAAWHLLPNGHTLLMDVIPITLFIHIYLVAALRRLFELSARKVFGWWLVYVAASVVAQLILPPDLFHGTVMYLPTYFTMVLLTFALAQRDRAIGRRFALITTVWSVSLIARTVDLELCAQLPIGTHFLWHTLNAWVLYQLLMVLVKQASSR